MRKYLSHIGAVLFQWHILWLIVAGIFGMCMVFVLPPLQVMDEPLHFARSVALSEGKLFCFWNEENLPGMLVPSEVRDAADRFDVNNVPYKPNLAVSEVAIAQQMQTKPGASTAFVQHPFCETPFWSSIPQAVGIDIAKLMGGSLLDWLYAGRLANLFASLVLIALAIRITPIGKPFFAVTASLPMFLQQISSLSLDGMHYALLFVFTALMLRLALSNKKLSIKMLVGLVLLSLVAIHAKTGFVFFALLIFLLDRKHFSSKKFQYLFSGLFVAMHLVVFMVIRVGLSVSAMANKGAINREEQVSYVLNHPWDFVMAVLRATENNFDFYWKNMLGVLGWIDTPLMNLQYLLLLVVLIILLTRRTKDHLTARHRWVLFGTWGLVMLSIFGALYAISTPVGGPEVLLVQGKYFLPVLPLLLLALHNMRFSRRWALPLFVVAMVVSGALMIHTIADRYLTSQVVDVVPLTQTASPFPLTSKSMFDQRLVTTALHLRGLNIYVQRPEQPSESKYRLTIRDENCTRILTQKEVRLDTMPERGYLTVLFEPLDVPVGATVCWNIDPDQRSVVQPLSIFTDKPIGRSGSGTTLSSAPKKLSGRVVYQALYKQ